MLQVVRLFIKLQFATSTKTLAQASKEDEKIRKKLINNAKKILRSQNMELSFVLLDSIKPTDDTMESRHDQVMTPQSSNAPISFSHWLHSIIVRPFAPFIPDLVKKVVNSLEIEELVIDLDIEKLTKQ